MVFLVQPLIAYVNGEQVINTPVTKSMKDVCSSSDDELCTCVTGELLAGWTTRLFTAPKQTRTMESKDANSPIPEVQTDLRKKEVQTDPRKKEVLVQIRDLHLSQTKRFSLKELRVATKKFSSKNRLGKGGFGVVFKGKLKDGRVVAVKRLSDSSKQGEDEFLREVQVGSLARHKNLVPLYGYCETDKEKMLVYPFVSNGNLQQHLKMGTLDWRTRKKVALGVARGLAHMHEYCSIKIIHRDVKPANILLDDKFEPFLTDFGLTIPMVNVPNRVTSEDKAIMRGTRWSVLEDDNITHVTTRVLGTHGYAAPDYVATGRCSEKVDVYAFGVVIQQLVSGHARPICMGTDCRYVWLRNLVGDMDINKIVDSRLQGEYVKEEVNQMIKIGLLCTFDSPEKRPQISKVIRMLEGVVTAPEWDNISKELYCSDIDTCCSWSGEAATGNDELESHYNPIIPKHTPLVYAEEELISYSSQLDQEGH